MYSSLVVEEEAAVRLEVEKEEGEAVLEFCIQELTMLMLEHMP
jgi:hypothetical protein